MLLSKSPKLICLMFASLTCASGTFAADDKTPVVPPAGATPVNGKEKPKDLATITGTVEFDGQVQFDKDAVVSVKLLDVSLMDAAAITLGEFKLNGPTKFPIPFKISYDPAALKQGVDFAIGVRIETNGKLNFINDTRIPVLGRGAPPADQPVKAPVKAVK